MAAADARAAVELAAALEPALPGRVELDAPLAGLTTYRVGGPAAVMVRARREGDLAVVAAALRLHRPPLLIVGRGSNLLVADGGFRGLALVLEGEFEEITPGEGTVRAGGAVGLPVLARQTAAAGRAGLEFYVGIPGTVGGAVRMNAGGHGQETREVLISARVADLLGDGLGVDRAVDDLALGYRTSAIGPTDVVVGATFGVTADDPAACEARIADVVRWRREHQPGGANAGSVFRNPPGDSAGGLIDRCGLKDLRVGDAVVSSKHANFIQAEPGATAADVRALVREVQRRVLEATGVELQPELHLVGFDDESEGR
ncbi:MAG TPA: UDP-N-acetylmuramate dehydrogenase [Acidimicrobiia bacterium]